MKWAFTDGIVKVFCGSASITTGAHERLIRGGSIPKYPAPSVVLASIRMDSGATALVPAAKLLAPVARFDVPPATVAPNAVAALLAAPFVTPKGCAEQNRSRRWGNS
jgi:hypothetical protein